MKYKNDAGITYLNHLQTAWYTDELIDIQEVNNLLNSFKNMGNAFQRTLPLFFIINYTEKSYAVISEELKTIAGYHPQEFLEAGLDILLDVFNKDDFKVFNNNIFKRNAEMLLNAPAPERNNYVFTFNFRFKRKDKKTAHVLQKGAYVTSQVTGAPLYSLGTITDITDVKTDNTIVHTIEKQPSVINKELIERYYYYPDPENSLLTKREKDVLKYMTDGLSSKQIAEKLNISENTIDNHRQNMMRKTNAKNVAELVAIAIKKRLI